MTVQQVLDTVRTILLIDWPSREVPEALARHGFEVVVKGGPGPDDYSAYEVDDGQVVSRHIGHRPVRADLVYSYRPLSELPAIVALAKQLGARAIWTQSGLISADVKDSKGCWLAQQELEQARSMVEAAGLGYLSSPYIVAAISAHRVSRQACG